MTDYENNPRYEKQDEGIFYDTKTDEVVFLVGEEEQKLLKELLKREPDVEDGYRLTEYEFKDIFNSDLNEL